MSELLNKVRTLICTRHYSYRTEKTYVQWIKQFILFHDKRHPVEMGAAEVTNLLSRRFSTSCSFHAESALAAILFLYRQTLGIDLPADIKPELGPTSRVTNIESDPVCSFL